MSKASWKQSREDGHKAGSSVKMRAFCECGNRTGDKQIGGRQICDRCYYCDSKFKREESERRKKESLRIAALERENRFNMAFRHRFSE